MTRLSLNHTRRFVLYKLLGEFIEYTKIYPSPWEELARQCLDEYGEYPRSALVAGASKEKIVKEVAQVLIKTMHEINAQVVLKKKGRMFKVQKMGPKKPARWVKELPEFVEKMFKELESREEITKRESWIKL